MGEVYLCLNEANLEPLALKTFQQQNPQLRAVFEEEVKNWIAIKKHPNIVQCHWMQIFDNVPFIGLEWVASEKDRGTDLRSGLLLHSPSKRLWCEFRAVTTQCYARVKSRRLKIVRFKLNVLGCHITTIDYTARGLNFVVESQALDSIGPICGTRTVRIHSYYERQLLDLPLGKLAVRLRVRAKRFRFLCNTCQRRTFAECIPDLTKRYARHTKRLSDIIWHLGQVVG